MQSHLSFINSRTLLLPVAAILLTGGGLSAQPPAEQTAVPAAEIPEQAAKLAAKLREIAARCGPDAGLEEITKELKGFAGALKDLEDYTRESLSEKASASFAADLRSVWLGSADRLQSWSKQLQDRAEALDGDRVFLSEAEKEWELTLASESFRDLPEQARQRLAVSLEPIRSARQAVRGRRSDIAMRQADLMGFQIRVDAAIERVRAVESQRRLGLLQAEEVPIWRAFGGARATATSAPAPVRMRRTPQWLVEFAVRELRRAAMVVVLAFGLWLLLRWCRRWASEWEGSPDRHVQALALFVRRPVSTALLLAVSAGALTLRGAPESMLTLAGFVLLIPTLRLLPAILAGEVRWAYYLLVLLLLLGVAVTLLPETSGMRRAGLLAHQMAAAAALVWLWALLRRRGTPGRWAAAMRALATVGMAATLAAIPANAAGMVELSQMLTRFVLLSFFGAVVVRGAIVLLAGVLLAAQRSALLERMGAGEEKRSVLERRLLQAVHVLGLVLFSAGMLKLTGLLDPLFLAADAAMGKEFRLGALTFTPYAISAFALILMGAVVFSNGLRFALHAGVYPRLGWERGQSNAVTKITHYAVLLGGFLLAVAAAGVDLSHVALLAGGLSVGIGLGLQNVVNNFVSGLILLFERPIEVGDGVTVGQTAGVVEDIGIRSSLIRTWEGAEVIIPNGELASGTLTNWTHSDTRRRVDITVGAAYGSDSSRVIELLAGVARRHALVQPEPEPVALFTGFGESSLDFVLRFWCDTANWVTVSSEIHTQIDEAFKEAGIEIPFPQRDVRIRSVPPAVAQKAE